MNNRQKNKQSPYIFQYQPPSNKNKTSQQDAIASDNSLIDPIDSNTVTQFQPSSNKNKTSQRDVATSSTSLIDLKRTSQSQLPSSNKSKNKTSQRDTAASSTSLIDPYRVSQSQLPSYESQRDAAASSTSDLNRPLQLEPNISTVAGIQKRLENIQLPESLQERLWLPESLRSLRNVTEQEATTRLPTATYKELLTEKKIEEAKASSGEMKHLQEQVEILATVNEELGNKNDELQSKLKIFDKYRLPRGINYESSGDSSKCRKITKSKKSISKKAKGSKMKRMNRYDAEEYSPESSLENISETSDKEEMDEVNIEMKTILKGVNEENGLNYKETFNSLGNLKVRGRLIKELRENMAPKYHPSVNQLTKWLDSIHKSRRFQAKLKLTGKIEGDHRRVYCNSRLNDKKFRRIKVAKDLFKKHDKRIENYDERSLLKMLSDRYYHFPEISEDGDDGSVINVYDYSWRSDELKNLLQNVLDAYSLTIQSAQLQRSRYYDDEHDMIFDTTEHEKSTKEYRSEINEELEETVVEIEEVLLAGGNLTMDY
uniref:Uncharacterized protein n=1 Tax=Rhizophagus irregularis (strain DAOM 181602 / DAOM 197198 / MUCL 43194) TaxID=747089 RepID=U9UEW4_RHIID